MEERKKIKDYLKKRGFPYLEEDIDEFIDGFNVRKKIALEIAKTDISEKEYIEEARSRGVSEEEIKKRLIDYKEDLEMGICFPLNVFNIGTN